MGKEELTILTADLREQQKQIEALYRKIASRKKNYARDEVALESLAYQLHNLYSAFEDLFRLVANHFENHIADPTGWHKELLKRMKTPIPGVRPAFVSLEALELLDGLRSFRHVFRHAYGFDLEPEKVRIVLQKALKLKGIYKRDLLAFLKQLQG